MGGFLGSLTGANQANAANQAAQAQAEAARQAAAQQAAAYNQSANIQSGAATGAANLLKNAYGEGTNSLVGGYNDANNTLNAGYGSAIGMLQPYANLGTQATNQLSQGIGDGSLTRAFGASDFNADPGYAWRKQQGMDGIQQSAAAGGGLMSGATMKALQTNNQNLASQEYGNAYARYGNDQTNRYNRLFGLSQSGQGLAQGMGNLAYQNAGNVAQNQIGIGNAQYQGALGAGNAGAQGLLGSANAQSQGLLGAAGAIGDGYINAGNSISAGTIGAANSRGQGAANLLGLGARLAGQYLPSMTGVSAGAGSLLGMGNSGVQSGGLNIPTSTGTPYKSLSLSDFVA